MAQLLDQYGRPIDKMVLKAEIAGPSTMGVRQVISGHPSRGLTPQKLAGILLGAEVGDPVSFLELAEDMEEKYLHYLAVLGQRKRAVAQLEITVEAAEDAGPQAEHAELVRDWLDRDELEDELFDMLDALGKGFSVIEIVWDTSANQWMPERLEWRDPRWFDFDRGDGRTPLLRVDAGRPEPLAPFKFITHTHKAKSGLPIRGGLARAAAWAYLFQNYALKDWVAFAEIFGLPLRVGRYDNGETEDNIRLLARAVAMIGSDAAAVFPKSMDVEFFGSKEGGGGGGSGDLFDKLCAYLDRQVSKAVVGQTATTDADTGGLGSGKEHGEVRQDIKLSDAKQLAGSINRQLVRPLIDLNFGPQRGYPRVRVGLAESVDIEKRMPAIESFVRMGGRVSAGEVRDRLGLEDPGPQDELLAVQASAADPAASGAKAPPAAANDTGQKTPQDGAQRPDGPGAAPSASRGSKALLRALKEHLEAGPAPGAAADAMDGLTDAALDDWEALIGPQIAAVEELLAGCATIEEARERLAEAGAELPVGPLTRALAEAGFTAHLAGLAGADPVGGS